MALRPRYGIHEIMQMMLDVQNGTVKIWARVICEVNVRT